MKIHDVKVGKNRFCGPAAVSAITGRPVDEVATTFRVACDRRNVMGTSAWEVREVLSHYGLSLRTVPVPQSPRVTFAKWLRLNKAHRTPGRVFLIAAGHHWLVTSGRRAVCGKTKVIVSVVDYPHRRAYVSDCYEVEGTVTRRVPEVVAKVEARRKEPRLTQIAIAAARKNAAPFEIRIDRADDYWEVIPPEGVFSEEEGDGKPIDPREGDHIAWDVAEVREAVEVYIKALTAAQTSTPTTNPEIRHSE